MKKYISVLFLSLILIIPSSAFATENNSVDAGLTPDSPLYFLDTLGEKISLFFTFDDDSKLEKELLYADERLAEMEVLSEAEDVNEDLLEELENAYNEKIANAVYLANQGENKENRLQVIEQARLRHVENMQRVLDKAPEEAQPALQKVLDKAQVKLDDIQNQIEQENTSGNENGKTDRDQLRDRINEVVNNSTEDNSNTTDTDNSNSNSNSSNGNSENSGSSNGNSGR